MLFVFLFFLVLIVIIVAFLMSQAESQTAASVPIKQELYAIGGTDLDRFFVECVLAGCTDFSQEKNIAKAKLFAEKYGVSYADGIENIYKQGLEEHKAMQEREAANKLAQQRKKDEEVCVGLERFAEFYGKEKKKAMLTERMQELRKSADATDYMANAMMRSTQQRESDWAIWGGIADGLAGAGAGIATALEIRAENAQIRARNEANRRAMLPAYMMITGNASENRSHANQIEKEIRLLQEKLISDASADDVMEKLQVTDTTVDVLKTGSLMVTATVEVKEKLFIYNDVPAVADGTLLAHIYDDEDNEVGTAKMVLPVEGVFEKTGVAGMCLGEGKPKKKYYAKFAPYKLWLMEK